MKTLTQKQFFNSTHLPESLVKSVIQQSGGWTQFTESAPDIYRHGIDCGFGGFAYFADTEKFAKKNLATIRTLAINQAKDLGMSCVDMIQGFGCFRHDKPSEEQVMCALYTGTEMPDSPKILNALAWYAGEESARSYCDLTEQN